MPDVLRPDRELAKRWESDPSLARLLPLADSEIYVSLTTALSKTGAMVFEDIEALRNEDGMSGPLPPEGNWRGTGVISAWGRRIHGLVWATDDFPDSPERDRVVAARRELVEAAAAGLKVRYGVGRDDVQANDLLVTLDFVLEGLETGARTVRDRRVAAAWMLHLADVRHLAERDVRAIVGEDVNEMARLADVVQRMIKRRQDRGRSRDRGRRRS